MRVEIVEPKTIKDVTINGDMPKKRVAGYARVSTEKDEQFSSYEAQIEHYTNYINNNKDWVYAGMYTDEGISGTSTKNRIGFQKMIKDALKGKIDLIITKSISRFARNTLDSLTAIRKLKEAGVEVYFEKENIWTLDSKGELLITIMSSIAQEESRSISTNVTWGIRESMKKGKAYVPYKVFLGYEKGLNGEMVINEEQAKIVRRIFGMAMIDISAYHIAKTLESEHVEFSPGVYKWHASTIRSILRNEKYKGDAIRQKTYTKDFLSKEKANNNGDVPQYYIHDHHQAIIPSYLFDRLQESLNNKTEIESKRSKNYIFSKRIICGCCGGLYGHVLIGEIKYWRCNNKYKGKKKHCGSLVLKESFILEEVIKMAAKRIAFQTIISFISKQINDKRIIPVINLEMCLSKQLSIICKMASIIVTHKRTNVIFGAINGKEKTDPKTGPNCFSSIISRC